jgi:hypothetical protein
MALLCANAMHVSIKKNKEQVNRRMLVVVLQVRLLQDKLE